MIQPPSEGADGGHAGSPPQAQAATVRELTPWYLIVQSPSGVSFYIGVTPKTGLLRAVRAQNCFSEDPTPLSLPL